MEKKKAGGTMWEGKSFYLLLAFLEREIQVVFAPLSPSNPLHDIVFPALSFITTTGAAW